MQQKCIKLKITESSCLHVHPGGKDGIIITWTKDTDVDRISTTIRLSKSAAMKTIQAILDFYTEDPTESA